MTRGDVSHLEPTQIVPNNEALLDRLLRRGKVEIEHVVVTVGYTPFVSGEPQYAIQEPAVQVKWWASYDRQRSERSATWRRFWPTTRITMWFYDSIFSKNYYETAKPTLREALADVEEQTRPSWRALDDLVADNEHWKQGVRIVEGLIRCAV